MQHIRIYTAKSKSSIKNGEQIICRKDFFLDVSMESKDA